MSKLLHKVFRQISARFSSGSQTESEATVKVVFVRHGESEWNKKNQFTGWFDSELSEKGREEAHCAGQQLKELGIKFDRAFTSGLRRAQHTLKIIFEELGQCNVRTECAWQLNERHYGNLTGMNKAEAAELFGADKVHTFRRSFEKRPPPILDTNPIFCDVQDASKQGMAEGDEVPLGESLKDTAARTLPYWHDRIGDALRCGESVIVAAHGNSLRSIVMEVESFTPDGIQHVNIPTGVPFTYALDSCLKATRAFEAVQFFGDEKKVEAAMADILKAREASSADDCAK